MRLLASSLLIGVASAACDKCPLPGLNVTAFLPCLKPVIGEDCCVMGRPMVNNPCVKVWLANAMLAPYVKIVEKARIACKVDQMAPCEASVAASCPTECGTPNMVPPVVDPQSCATMVEEFTECGSSSCWEDQCVDKQVKKPGPMCTMDCKRGCRCKSGFARDVVTKKCVSALQCAGTNVTACQARAAFEKAACGNRMGCEASVKCNDDGSFVAKQCRGSTGTCWCVDKDGNEIADSRKGPSDPQPNCGMLGTEGKGKPLLGTEGKGMMGGEGKGNNMMGGKGNNMMGGEGNNNMMGGGKGNNNMMGGEGKGKTMLGTEGQGKPLLGTEGQGRLGTEGQGQNMMMASSNMTKCQARAASEKAACAGKMGCNTLGSKCNDDGSFAPKQCRGSTGYCWCVDADGNEIEGSRKGPSDGEVNCADNSAPQVMRTENIMMTSRTDPSANNSTKAKAKGGKKTSKPKNSKAKAKAGN